jgi:ferredoxin
VNTQDIPAMQELLKALPAAEKEVVEAEQIVRVLHLKDGQNTAVCRVGGLCLSLTYENRDTGYMPRVVPGRQALLALLRKEAHDHLIACRSKVEGIRYRIRKLSRSAS